ncbi:MAG: hypothetical protein EXS47_01685 [Candidatus Zambryskibacteria bacterium]|nr:hypothetical protein [Candidatus Zambryskibacteria bacterium]
MNIQVIIECEVGSDQRNVFDEVTLQDKVTFTVARRYPFPYGFIQNTKSGDGDCLDCFVLTKQALKSKSMAEVEVIGMFEQFETRDGIKKDDHKIIARIENENVEVNEEIKNILKEFVLHVWDYRIGKKVEVGKFYGKEEAEALVKRLRLPS